MSIQYMPSDKYGFFHLATHLSRAGFIDELYELVTNNIWRENSKFVDPSGYLFKADIDIAYRSVERYIQALRGKNYDGDVLAEKLSWLTILAFVSAGIGQSASRIPPKILEAMARLGRSEQALKSAAGNPDPIKRAESLIWLGLVLFQQGQTRTANRIWEDVHLLLTSLQADLFDENIEMLGEMVSVLALVGEKSKSNIITLELEELIRTKYESSGGITSSAKFALVKALVSIEETSKVLNLVSEFHAPDDKIKALWIVFTTTNMIISENIVIELVSIAKSLSLTPQNEISRQQLAEIFASVGNIDQAMELLRKNQGAINRLWVLRAYAGFLLSHGNQEAAHLQFERIIDIVKSISKPSLRLQKCSELIIGTQRDSVSSFLMDLLPLMQKDFDSLLELIDSAQLGSIAVAFCILGDASRAEAAIDKGINYKFDGEDWNEAFTFIKFAEAFGISTDPIRFGELLQIVSQRRDLWQKAEILLSMTRFARLLLDKKLSGDIDHFLGAIHTNQQGITKQPNTLGPVAVWMWESCHRNANLNEILNLAISYLAEDDDQADGLAFLALSLALNNLGEWADRVVAKTLLTVQNEQDPNILARVTGTLAQVAVYQKRNSVLEELKKIPPSIDDEWMQAEALFWISSGSALLKFEQEARDLFKQAFRLGSWNEVNVSILDQLWVVPAIAEQYLLENHYIGWHSTRVAATFAWLAIAAIHPPDWLLQTGMQVVNTIPEEFSEKRSECIALLISTITEVDNKHQDFIDLYLNALFSAKDRQIGEVWAVLRACVQKLKGHFGNAFVIQTWDAWVRVKKILE